MGGRDDRAGGEVNDANQHEHSRSPARLCAGSVERIQYASPSPAGFVPDTQSQSAAPAPAPSSASQPAPMATMSAIPQPTTVSGRVERWAQNVSDDLKYGTDLTGIGTVLKKMGAVWRLFR
jgi:hypothetical protein